MFYKYIILSIKYILISNIQTLQNNQINFKNLKINLILQYEILFNKFNQIHLAFL